MNDITFTKFVISKEELSKLSDKQVKRLIMITFMLRDLNHLQKVLFYINNYNAEAGGPEEAAKESYIFFFLKTLISKIYEMWKFLKENKILKDTSDFKSAVDEINKFFKDGKTENILGFIRNKFGFHYEHENKVDTLIVNALNQFDYYEVWSAEEGGNEVFKSSNDIILRVIFDKMKELKYIGNDMELTNILLEKTLEGARILRDFSLIYIRDGLSIKWDIEKSVAIKAPVISHVKLPPRSLKEYITQIL